jgi:hypothetical protein
MGTAEVITFNISAAVHNPSPFSVKFADNVVRAVAIRFFVRNVVREGRGNRLGLVLLAAAIEEYLDGRPDEHGADFQSARLYGFVEDRKCPHEALLMEEAHGHRKRVAQPFKIVMCHFKTTGAKEAPRPLWTLLGHLPCYALISLNNFR